MMERKLNVKVLILCAIAVCMNVILGSVVTYTHIPLLYLDAIGTIFIAVNFKMKYGIITGISTNLLLAVIHGPLAIPFGLVSIVIAVVSNLCARRKFTNMQAVITGILLVVIGALVSAPLHVILFGGLSNSITDVLIISIRASGREMITAAYWGAVVNGIVDKVLSCLFVVQLNKLPQLKRFVQPIFNTKEKG